MFQLEWLVALVVFGFLILSLGCSKEMTVQNRPLVGEKPAYEVPENTRTAVMPNTNDVEVASYASEQTALNRGHERFEIYCTPCHDSHGTGNGRVTARGFPKSPPLVGPGSNQFSESKLVDIISDGIGIMHGYGNLIPLSDKQAIVAYLQHLKSPSEVETK